MLQKRIDLGSIPYGLAIAGEDIPKGRAVVIKADSSAPNGVKAMLPTTEADADAVKGFATFRVETDEGNDIDSENDVIKEGDWVVIYTLVKDNMWATDQFVGSPSAGDELVVAYESGDEGKLRARNATDDINSRASQFKVFDVQEAGAGYTNAMVEVEVL